MPRDGFSRKRGKADIDHHPMGLGWFALRVVMRATKFSPAIQSYL
jgi:hypothetical protein